MCIKEENIPMSKSENQYSYHVARNEMREKAIELHFNRYLEVGFFKKGEEDPFEKDSVYFAAVDETENKVVGVNRLIFKPMNELPALKEFLIYDIEKRKLKQLESFRYAEMSALTKLPQHDCTIGMLRETIQYSLENGITHWFCSLDERVYRYMNRMFHFPFQQIGEPKVYLGSNTIPCILDLKESGKALKDTRFKLYEYLFTPNVVEAVK
jgi:N-acyl-L-homoserine lactone synthetase